MDTWVSLWAAVLFALRQIKRQRTVQSGSAWAKHHVLDGLHNGPLRGQNVENDFCEASWFIEFIRTEINLLDKQDNVFTRIMMAADIHAPLEMLDERRLPARQYNGTNNEKKNFLQRCPCPEITTQLLKLIHRIVGRIIRRIELHKPNVSPAAELER